MENQYGVGLYQDGVFYFTNPGLDNEDFVALWNNKEYTFKSKTTVPLIIPNEIPENIQVIRKRFAKAYAQKIFHKSKKYKDLVKQGGYIPATYDEDTEFKNTIQACLTPLPKSQATIKELPRESEDNYKGSKAIGTAANLNEAFKDYEIPTLGAM
jgi:hypothetical protein